LFSFSLLFGRAWSSSPSLAGAVLGGTAFVGADVGILTVGVWVSLLKLLALVP